MPNVSMPDIPYSRYIEIVRFITLKLQKESVGIPGKQLIQFYLDQYLDTDRLEDQPYVEGEKQLIVQIIKYTVQESLLKAVPLPGGVGFVIHPLCKIASKKDTPNHKRMIDDTYLESSPRRSQSEGEEDEAWGDQLYQDEEEEEAEVHANAYTEMTRRAISRPTSRQRQHPDTPSRKRKRTDEVAEEIADSNASSRMDSLSPRHPSRYARRLSNPVEENRRRSAPSRLDSPVKANTPRKSPYGEIPNPAITFKMEKTSKPSSIWIMEKCDDLRKKWNLDRITYNGEDLICLDCDKSMRTFNTHGTRTSQFFESHLRASGHAAAREARREKQTMKDIMLPTSCQYSTAFASAIPQPVQCYSLPSIQNGETSSSGQRPLSNLRSTMNECIDAIESQTTTQTQLIQRLENEATKNQMQNQQQFEEMKEAVEASEKRRKQQLQHMDEKFATSTARNVVQTAQLDRITDQLKEANSKSQRQLDEIAALLRTNEAEYKSQITTLSQSLSTQVYASQDFQNSLGRFSLVQSRYQEQFEQMAKQIMTLEKANEEREGYIHDLESTLQLHSEHLQTLKDNEDELKQSLSTRLETHSQLTAERISALEIETEEWIRATERANADEMKIVRKETIKQLEQSRRSNTTAIEAIRKEFTDQLTAAQKANTKDARELRDEMAETIQALEKENNDKITSLKEANIELMTQIEGYNGLFGDLFKEMEQMQGKFQELAQYLETNKSREPREKRRATLPRARRRKVSVRTSRSASSASTSFSSVLSA